MTPRPDMSARRVPPRAAVAAALLGIFSAVLSGPGSLSGTALAATPAGSDEDFFERHIRPLLVEKCSACHSGPKAGGGLSLDTREGWAKGGDSGPAIVPGSPDESLLLEAVSGSGSDWRMPPEEEGEPLSEAEVARLREWIAGGAFDPRVAERRIGGMKIDEARSWWAFQPLLPPAEPITSAAIDDLLDEAIGARGLEPNGPADARTLIRRATYDLTGLPPTPAAVEAFVADTAPDRFERLVDRLLASPEYGVHQGRRWLDIVRYADTAGENTDRPLPHVWRYRNWVCDAFNRDLPYPEFVRLQIAGDILRADEDLPRRNEGIIATGYLANARRFGHDIESDIHLMHEDLIDNLGKTFLGLTVACARCHDHKFDAVSAGDYYALYGVFESTRFPFPGSEGKTQIRDLVPLVESEDAAAILAAWHEQPKPGPFPDIPWAYAVAEGEIKNAKIQQRGEPAKPGDEVARRWLEVLGGQAVAAGSGSGRRELAEWIVASPLASRVIVNRVWQWHFGTGLVSTSNDFGSRGERPSHPELLERLAADFEAAGGHFKRLHRILMLTAAYRRASTRTTPVIESDPENRLLARFERRRLTAEEIRDTLLVAAGRLDPLPGEGHPFPPEATWKFTQHEPFHAVYDSTKRSIYLMVQRQRRHPFLALFDGADPNASTPVRQTTTVPTQALYFLNDRFFHEQAAGLARRLLAEPDPSRRVDRGFALALQRSPAAAERAVAMRLLETYPGDDEAKWSALARVLLASSEFVHVD